MISVNPSSLTPRHIEYIIRLNIDFTLNLSSRTIRNI